MCETTSVGSPSKKNGIVSSFKWVFSTTIVRRIVSFLLFLYIVRAFSREELGVYREFVMIIMLSSLVSTFSFNMLLIVEKSKKYLFLGLQYIIISSAFLGLVLLCSHRAIATRYSSELLGLFILAGFWIVIPESIKRLIRSVHQSQMNFKFLSVVETIVTLFYTALTFLLFFVIEVKFSFFVVAFFMGSLLELCIIGYPLRRKIWSGVINSITLRYIKPLKKALSKNMSFLVYTTVPTTINQIVMEAPILILGMYFAPSLIGIYFIATQIVSVPISYLMGSISQILFPAFSWMDRESLRHKVKMYIQLIVYVMWFLILCFGILIKYFGHLIVGSQDIAIISSIVVAITYKALVHLILNPLSSIPTVLKKPQYELYWSVGSIVCVSLLLYILRGGDFIEMIYYYIAITTMGYIVFLVIICKMIGLPIRELGTILCKGVLYCSPLIAHLYISDRSQIGTGIGWLVVCAGISAFFVIAVENRFLREILAKFF
jgi:O-antigen/teichoic acid export membrane protein